mmetsp:Transcript_137404/g.293641  ORF Transcript_137404/g.293641 Transcript_137404/m.293641 type:complete len:570 (+) Transcript_137404:87-1796(+)
MDLLCCAMRPYADSNQLRHRLTSQRGASLWWRNSLAPERRLSLTGARWHGDPGRSGARRQSERRATANAVEKADIIISVMEATLTARFSLFGVMDLYAVVEWEKDDGDCSSISRTPTLWMSSSEPKWEHVCQRLPYSARPEEEGTDKIVFEVMQEGYSGFGDPSTCGCAIIPVSDLLDSDGQTLELALFLDDEATGTITVRACVETREEKSLAMMPSPATVKSQKINSKDSGSTQCVDRTPSLSCSEDSEFDSDAEGRGKSPAKRLADVLGMGRGQEAGAAQPRQGGRSSSRGHSPRSRPRVLSNSSSDGEDMGKGGASTPAQKVSEAMNRHWNKATENRGLCPAAQELRNSFSSVASVDDRKSGRGKSPQKEAQALVHAISNVSLQTLSAYGDEEERLEALSRRLRAKATKYPRQGKSKEGPFFSMGKERFFTLWSEELDLENAFKARSFGSRAWESLSLAWYSAEAAWDRKESPLGRLAITDLREVTEPSSKEQGQSKIDNLVKELDIFGQKELAYTVSITFRDDTDVNDPQAAGQMSIRFKSKCVAEEWSCALQECLKLVQSRSRH